MLKKPQFQSLLITANRKQPSPPHYFHFSLVSLCLSDQLHNITSHSRPTSWALLAALGSASSSRVGHGFHVFQNSWDSLSKAERGKSPGADSSYLAPGCWGCHQGTVRPFLIYGIWQDAQKIPLLISLILYLPLLPWHLCAQPGKALCFYIQSISRVGPQAHSHCQAEVPFALYHHMRKVTAPRKRNLVHRAPDPTL